MHQLSNINSFLRAISDWSCILLFA